MLISSPSAPQQEANSRDLRGGAPPPLGLFCFIAHCGLDLPMRIPPTGSGDARVVALVAGKRRLNADLCWLTGSGGDST